MSRNRPNTKRTPLFVQTQWPNARPNRPPQSGDMANGVSNLALASMFGILTLHHWSHLPTEIADLDERWAVVFAPTRAFSWYLVCSGSRVAHVALNIEKPTRFDLQSFSSFTKLLFLVVATASTSSWLFPLLVYVESPEQTKRASWGSILRARGWTTHDTRLQVSSFAP